MGHGLWPRSASLDDPSRGRTPELAAGLAKSAFKGASRQQHGVEFIYIGVSQAVIDVEVVGFVVMLERLNFPLFRRKQGDFSSCLLERIHWFPEFGIFYTVTCQNGNP